MRMARSWTCARRRRCRGRTMRRTPPPPPRSRAPSVSSAARSRAVIATYPGLPHRQQRIATIDGVAFVNDSKGTNADATARALGCYGRLIWIAGGIAKAGGIAPLAPYFPRLAHALLIGRDGEDFAATLAAAGVPHSVAGTLERGSPGSGAPRARDRRAGRAAVAGSGELRSVQRLRGARRALRRAGRRARPAGREGCLMPTLSRADNSLLGRWWWTVDRWTLIAVAALIGFGYVLMLAASPSVAERIGAPRDVFIVKQLGFLVVAGHDRGRDLDAVAARHPAAGAGRLRHRARAHRAHAGEGRRDQGCAALDRAAGHVDPAIGVPEALLRRRHRLADRRRPADARLPRHADRLRPVRADPAAAEVAARYRHARGGERRVLRAALRGRDELRLRRHRRRADGRRRRRRLHDVRACAEPRAALHPSRMPATTTR